MSRSYGRIQNYEKEIKEMLEQGLTHREIGEAFGFSKEQVKGFVKRMHAKERRLAAGEALKKQGISAKDDKYTESDKISELKYMLVHKEAKIKQLEMENELMRDFLSLTGSEVSNKIYGNLSAQEQILNQCNVLMFRRIAFRILLLCESYGQS